MKQMQYDCLYNRNTDLFMIISEIKSELAKIKDLKILAKFIALKNRLEKEMQENELLMKKCL